METIDLLNKEFLAQRVADEQPDAEPLDKYKDMARNYAQLENVIAVLSDLRLNVSYIFYGKFSKMLGIENSGIEDRVSSIWEKKIFKLIHPDDLTDKHLHELCFLNFIKRQPKHKRSDYYLMSRMRMKAANRGYLMVLHRMFYIQAPASGSLWLALCLYGPLSVDIHKNCLFVNSANGQVVELDKQVSQKILSTREMQVLTLIDKGATSKEIAEKLSISINTVSRHRQEILCKLQVRNSIEACRVAKSLKLL